MKIVAKLFANAEATLLTLFFVFFSFGQLQRIQLTNDLALYGHNVIIVCFVLWQLIVNKKIQEKIKNIPAILKKFATDHQLELAWLVWLVGSMIAGTLAGRVGLRGWLYLSRLLLYIFFIFLVKKSNRVKYQPQAGVALVGLLITGWGLLQYFIMPDTRWLNVFGWDNHYYRLISTLFDPAFTGMLLVMTFGLWQLPTIFPRLSIRFKQTIQLLITIAIAATFSRASYIALLIFSGLQVINRKIKLSFFALILAIFLVALIALPKPGGEGVNLARTSTGEARLINVQNSLAKLNGLQWLWGRGLFNADAAQVNATPSHAQLPDSLPVLIINSLGLGGLLLTLVLFAKYFKSWCQEKPVWASLFVAVLIHSLFNNTLFQPFIFLSLWLIF